MAHSSSVFGPEGESLPGTSRRKKPLARPCRKPTMAETKESSMMETIMRSGMARRRGVNGFMVWRRSVYAMLSNGERYWIGRARLWDARENVVKYVGVGMKDDNR